MQKYVIEREFPEAGKLTLEELKEVAKKSNAVLREMGTAIQWVESYITTDKIYCIYNAESEELLKEHGEKGGFPVDRIQEVWNMNDPSKGA